MSLCGAVSRLQSWHTMSETNNTNTADFISRLVVSVLCVLGLLIADLGLPLGRMYVASALIAAFLMYAFRKPPAIDWLAMLVLGPAATSLHTWLWFREWYQPSVFLLMGGLGIAAFLVLTMRWIWSEGAQRKQMVEIIVPSVALTAMLFASTSLNIGGKLWPETLDLYAFSFDASMGIQPSFWAGRLFANHLWFAIISTGAYFAVLIGMTLAHIVYEKRRPSGVPRTLILNACFAAGVIGFAFYQLYPACGPIYAFPRDFPFGGIPTHDIARLVLRPIPMGALLPRNAMPSLHMTWALLIWWNLRSCGRFAHAMGFVFAMLTAMGTLGTGEHYLVDLVVAFPFTLMIQSICCGHIPLVDRRRWQGIVAGLTTTLAWIIMLRVGIKFFWISPVIPWAAVVLTIAGALYLSLPVTRFERVSEGDSVAKSAELAASATPA